MTIASGGLALVTQNHKLEVLLGGAVTTSQLPFVATYLNIYTNKSETYATVHGQTNNGTAVTLVGSPNQGEQRLMLSIAVHNDDTVNAVVTVRLNDNGTTRKLITFTLATGVGLFYEQGLGWYSK